MPVDLVTLGAETASPVAPLKSAVPQEQSRRFSAPRPQSPPAGLAPAKKPPPEDAVEARLRGLAQLREPEKALPALDNMENSNADASSTDAVPGDEATYSLRDYIRAVVERHWGLDYAMLGKRDLKIAIHVQMTHNGKVMLAEIIDHKRYRRDAVFRNIAISVRNAVILSSPFMLPPGAYRDVMDMVITFDTKDTLH